MMGDKIQSILRAAAQTEDVGSSRRVRAPVCTVLGAGLILLGLQRKGAWGGVLAAIGGASLYRALSDWLEAGARAKRAGVVPGAGAAALAGMAAIENETLFGWAPESGEPGETRVGLGRCAIYSTAGDDVGFAPESGDRTMDREEMEVFLPEGGGRERAEDRVLEGSEESFPASDAPSWTPGRT